MRTAPPGANMMPMSPKPVRSRLFLLPVRPSDGERTQLRRYRLVRVRERSLPDAAGRRDPLTDPTLEL